MTFDHDRLNRRVLRLRNREKTSRERLSEAQNLRLITAGVFFLTLIVAAVRPQWHVELASVPLFIVVFSYFVVKTRRLTRFSDRLMALAAFYERHDLRQRGIPVERDWQAALLSLPGEVDATAVHDLNLIGAHSLFSLVDETVTDGGRQTLAKWITSPHLNRDAVIERQNLLQKLEGERWFFIRLLLSASETDWKISSHSVLEAVARPFLKDSHSRLIGIDIAVWVVCMILLGVSVLTGWASPVWFLMTSLVLNLYTLNQIGPVFLRGEGLSHHLSGLVPIFERLEGRLSNPDLKKLLTHVDSARPSRLLRRFNFILAFLSAESHVLVYLILNAFLPWAGVFSWLLERTRKKLAQKVPDCMEEFNRLEALVSLVFLRIYHTKTIPEITTVNGTSSPVLECEGLFHPLIDRTLVVANDFSFPKGKSLGLLTGSNMSGKSTFLRTIGINQTLANMGAPVFAKSMRTSILKLGSCIQVSDSLRDGFSYFYAEVIRLKTVIDQVQSGEPILFLIDEIFRGTNNRERQIGSRAVIRSLSAGKQSLGFVSTHDLELTSLDQTLPAVMNLHFREDFDGGEMRFYYRLQSGPCPTTNALKIMEKVGLDLEA